MFVAEVGNVTVATTNHRAHSSEELARMAVRKIIYVGDDLPTEISYSKLFWVILLYREGLKGKTSLEPLKGLVCLRP